MSVANGYAQDTFHQPHHQQRLPYHPFREATEGLEENAYGVFALPCPIDRPGQPGPYHRGSMSWSQYDRSFMHGEKFRTAFQIFANCMELKGSGTPTFVGTPGSPQVRATQMAYLRALMHKPKKGDDRLLSTTREGGGIRHTLSFDREVAEALHTIASGQLNDLLGLDARAHDEDMLGGGGYDADLGDGDDDNHQRYGRNRFDDNNEDNDEDEDEEAEREARILQIFSDQLSEEGQNIDEKVRIVVTHFTRPMTTENRATVYKRDEETGGRIPIRDDMGMPVKNQETGATEYEPEMEDAGCIVWFLIMDPLYSIGKSVRQLIEMCEENYNKRMGMGDADQDAGNRKRKFGPGANVSRLVRHFPWILEEPENALHSLSMRKYLDLAAFVHNKPDLLGVDKQKTLARGLDHPGTINTPNLLHPINMFTPEWAINMMQLYGVPEEKCSLPLFRGGEDYMIMEDPDELSKWYFPPASSYHYEMDTWVWNRNGRAGLKKQYTPWMEIPKELLSIASARTEDNALTLYEDEEDGVSLAGAYASAIIVPGFGTITPLPIVPYDPSAFKRHNAIFQVARENRKVLDDIRYTGNPLLDPDGYSTYCSKLQTVRKAAMMRMQQVLVPTAHISAPMKAIMTWGAQNVKRVSCPLPHYTMDPEDLAPDMMELDSFSCFMIREAMMVKDFRHIAQEVRHWQLSHWGALDCYGTRDVGIHYSAIYHGLSQSGKSYFLKDATVKTLIPGTVSQMIESSNRAFNTHDDFLGWVIFMDEMSNIYVDAKAAERDKSGAAERIKTMITDQKCTYRVLVFVDAANGRQKRVAEDIESAFHATMLCSTNKKVGGGDEAIASRFLNFVITRADCDLHEFLGIKNRLDDDDNAYKKDMEHNWKVKQMLVAVVMALIDSSVIPDVSMDVFDALNSRMMSYLQDQGKNTKEIRGAQMTKRLARVYVILNGLIQLFDVKGGLHEGKIFDIPQLLDIAPYLYCTKQIALMAFTQTGEIYMSPLSPIVIKGAFSFIRFPYKEHKTIQEYLVEDVSKRIPWMRVKEGEETKIDFNYIQLSGAYRDGIVKGVAQYTQPKVGDNEVDSELARLGSQWITVKRVPRISEEYYNQLGEQQLGTFTVRTDNVEPSKIQVVKREFGKAGGETAVFIAVKALEHFKEHMILDAFMHCIHDGFRPQEFVYGAQAQGEHPLKKGQTHVYTGIYNTIRITPQHVKAYSMGEHFYLPDISYLSPEARAMYRGTRMHPDKREENYSDQRQRRNKSVIQIKEDLDDWGLSLHHYRSGIRGDPSRSPAKQLTITNRIRQSMQQGLDSLNGRKVIRGGDPLTAMYLDYPNRLIEAANRQIVDASKARSFGEQRLYRERIFELQLEQWNRLSSTQKEFSPKPVMMTTTEIVSVHPSRSLVEQSQLYDKARAQYDFAVPEMSQSRLMLTSSASSSSSSHRDLILDGDDNNHEGDSESNSNSGYNRNSRRVFNGSRGGATRRKRRNVILDMDDEFKPATRDATKDALKWKTHSMHNIEFAISQSQDGFQQDYDDDDDQGLKRGRSLITMSASVLDKGNTQQPLDFSTSLGKSGKKKKKRKNQHKAVGMGDSATSFAQAMANNGFD